MCQQYLDFLKYKVVGSQTNHNFQKPGLNTNDHREIVRINCRWVCITQVEFTENLKNFFPQGQKQTVRNNNEVSTGLSLRFQVAR